MGLTVHNLGDSCARLTSQDEMRQGLSYFQETIFEGLPTFYRRIDTALSKIGQPHLPLDHNLFTFGSWMGGDRDGNPFVTPETTRDVVISARLTAVNLFFKAIERLMFELSVWRADDAMKVSRLEQEIILLMDNDCCCLQVLGPQDFSETTNFNCAAQGCMAPQNASQAMSLAHRLHLGRTSSSRAGQRTAWWLCCCWACMMTWVMPSSRTTELK